MTQIVESPPVAGRALDATVSLVDIVVFVRRNLWRILVPAVLATVLTGVLIVAFAHRTWKASVTLVVVPPKISSDLKPPTLTVQGYEKLLTSGSVVDETRRRLVKEGVLEPTARLRVGKELETKIFVARRQETTTLAPLIRAFARGKTPKQAAAIANTWAQVFLEKASGVMSGATDPVIKMVEANYTQARKELNDLENRLMETQHTYQRRINAAAHKWDRKITAYNTATSNAVAQYQAETTRLVNSFNADKNLATRQTQVDAVRKALADLQDEQARVKAQLARKKLELAAARRTLAETSQYITLRKAITDDALWNAEISGKDHGLLKKLKDSSLVTEAINPVYQELFDRTSKLEIEVNALAPRSDQLEQDIKAAVQKLQVQEKALQNDLSDLERLKQTRAAGLKGLQGARAEGLRKLQADRDLEIQSLQRSRDTAVAALQRDIDTQKAFFNQLAQNYNQALVAKSQMNTNIEDVRLLSPAALPSEPEPRGALTKGVLAGILAGMLGLFWALVREALRLGTPAAEAPAGGG